MNWTHRTSLAVAAGVVGGAWWWRGHPSACPYSQRLWLQAPHPFVTRRRLGRLLEASPGERLLELGPGTGYYSRSVAERLRPGGTLEILDLQREMLDHTLRETAAAGLDNVTATQGDACHLPYAAARFDAAYLVAVLGEIPDQEQALRELRRVLKPGGRLIVGELLGDPHMVTLRALRRRAHAAGLTFERRVGSALGYLARFRPAPPPD
jgi:ubiquinone/menaquinone biosynthesis C-methylase UbiE